MLSPLEVSSDIMAATTESFDLSLSTTLRLPGEEDWSSWNTTNTTKQSVLDGLVTTTEVPYEPYVVRPETYLVPIIFGIIFIVGVLGNGVLVVVFVRHRAMRNVPNT